ncbi:hypothetical protein Cfor_03217 [Coptotermes formosanus]|uniref:Uncharacterized protein n=1 Tax=Coptotermes formosanus TaxID=36987 RepID=A0A6L2PAB8_COPFO|nr:hypothetical protein Cfor_03217 [Coptotermes formosanus]
MTDVVPFLRSPFTDLTSCLINHQNYGRCEELEMRVMNCLEAYGTYRGMKKCKDLVDDFRECSSRRKQVSCLYVDSVKSAGYTDCFSKLS